MEQGRLSIEPMDSTEYSEQVTEKFSSFVRVRAYILDSWARKNRYTACILPSPDDRQTSKCRSFKRLLDARAWAKSEVKKQKSRK
jgi:hypothetical protein